MLLTAEIIESGQSVNGGWSRKQLKLFGVKWPLKKGWKRGLIGKEVDSATVAQFLSLTNAHIKSESVDGQFLEATQGI